MSLTLGIKRSFLQIDISKFTHISSDKMYAKNDVNSVTEFILVSSKQNKLEVKKNYIL